MALNVNHSYFPNITFEMVVVSLTLLLTLLTFYRWTQKKSKLRLILFVFFSFYFLALATTMISQIMDYLIEIDETTLFARYMISGKIAVFFTALGTLGFQFLSMNLFQAQTEINRKRLHIT